MSGTVIEQCRPRMLDPSSSGTIADSHSFGPTEIADEPTVDSPEHDPSTPSVTEPTAEPNETASAGTEPDRVVKAPSLNERLDVAIEECLEHERGGSHFKRVKIERHRNLVRAYRIYQLLIEGGETAENQLVNGLAHLQRERGFYKGKPHLLAVSAALNPGDEAERKYCSEQWYSIQHAWLQKFKVEEFGDYLTRVTLKEAKAAVRANRKAAKAAVRAKRKPAKAEPGEQTPDPIEPTSAASTPTAATAKRPRPAVLKVKGIGDNVKAVLSLIVPPWAISAINQLSASASTMSDADLLKRVASALDRH